MRANKGITIIVLIVTIIIMLILITVGVNIAIDDGIVKEASNTMDRANNRIEQEEQTANYLMNEWESLE